MTDLDREALQLLRLALDVEPMEREALIARHTEDPALAGRVRELLARVDDDEARAVAEPADVAGLMLGPYRVLRRIGRGGMGEVFLAERADGAWQREVALKRIWGGFSPLTERFLRERRVLARLQHPHIAQLLDGGVTEQGQPWFAMEYVRGAAITQWCDTHRADIDTRLTLLRQVCDAVQFAHAHLVVHRDIKPPNVLVGEDGRAKLLDFGIAKLLDDADAGPGQTHAMTPAWATPEQRRGDPVGTASDVYQLGLLLHALLVGAPPDRTASDGDNASVRIAATWAAIQRADAATAQTIAVARDTTAQRLQARLRGDLDRIVSKALAEDVDARYPTPQAFADDLDRWQRNLPVRAQPDAWRYRASRFMRRNRVASTLAAVLACVIAGAGVFGWQRLQAERLQFRRAEATVAFMRDIFVITTPDQTDGAKLTAEQLLDRASTRLQQNRSIDPIARAYLDGELGNTYVELGRPTKAELHLQRAIDGLLPQRAEHAEAYLEWLADLAFANIAAHRPEKALTLLENHEAFIAEQLRVPSRQRSRLLLQRGDAYLDLGRVDEAEQYFRRAVADLQASGERPGLTLINAQVTLGRLLSDRNQYKEALAYFDQARRNAKRVPDLGAGAADAMEYYRGLTLAHLGRYADAIGIYRALVPRWIAREGEAHPYTDVLRTALARAYSAQGRHAEARAVMAGLRRALTTHDADAERVAMADFIEARIEIDALNPSGGLAHAQAAVDYFDAAHTQPTPRRGRVRNVLGEALVQSRDCQRAEPVLRGALSDIEATLGRKPHIERARALDALGRCRMLRGDLPGARRLFTEALAQRLAIHGPEDRRTLRTLAHLRWAQALETGRSEPLRALRPRMQRAYGDLHPVLKQFDALLVRVDAGSSLPTLLNPETGAGNRVPDGALAAVPNDVPIGLVGGD